MGKLTVSMDIKNYWRVLIFNIFIGVKQWLFLIGLHSFYGSLNFRGYHLQNPGFSAVILVCELFYPLVLIFEVPRH